MKKDSSILISSDDFLYMLIGTIIGIFILSLPGEVVEQSGQDGWISVIIGGVYPLYAVFVAAFIIKKYPDKSILCLSKKYCGKLLGSIMNFIYMLIFLTFVIIMTVHSSNTIRIYGASYVTQNRICSIILFLAGYGAYKGIDILCKINKYAFFIGMMLLSISFMALRDGSILNVQPVLGSGALNILKAVKNTLPAYSMIEIIVLIHPFVRDKSNIIKAGVKCVFFTVAVYTWVVFITIYFLGVDITPKSFWSFVLVTESVKLPLINNFRFIFISLWLMVIFKSIANMYFAGSLILSYLINIDRKKICIFIYPLLFYITTLFENEVMRGEFVGRLIPYIVGFNLIYISLIALFTIFDNKAEKQVKKHKQTYNNS